MKCIPPSTKLLYMAEPKYVTITRNGKPKQVDQQVILWRRRRRKAAKKKKAQQEFLSYAEKKLGSRLEALRWLKSTYLPQYGVYAARLLQKGSVKALKWILDKQVGSTPHTPE